MSAPFLPISFAQLPAYMDLEAAGSSQLDAAQISGSINVYTIVPSGSGAVLPGSYSSGAEIIVFNRGANPLNVYPALDAEIESLGMNQPFPVPAGAVASFFCADPAIAPGRQWYSINWLAGSFATLSVSGSAALTGGGSFGGNWGGALNLTGSGTSLAVTNNASVGGALGVTGALSIGSTITLGTTVGAGGNVTIQTPNGSNIVLNPQGSGTVSVTSAMGAPIANIGGINVPIVSGSPTPLLNITGGLTGSITGSGITQWNNISVSNDSAAVTNLLADFAINHNVGGTGFSGGRSGILVNMVQTGPVAGTPGVFANVIQGMQSSVSLDNSFGGTGTTPTTAAGYATCFNPYLSFNAGFTNGGGGSGMEIDIGTATGATFMDVIGLLITRLDNGSQAARADAGLVLGGTTPSSGHGWKTLVSFGYGSGDTGLDPGGTLVGVDAASGLTAAYGVNLSAFTFTSDAFKSPGFSVDGSGNTTALTYHVSTNQVVGSRVTGWGVASNGSRTAFNGSTATLAQTSAAVAQLIEDLTTHGLIGA